METAPTLTQKVSVDVVVIKLVSLIFFTQIIIYRQLRRITSISSLLRGTKPGNTLF